MESQSPQHTMLLNNTFEGAYILHITRWKCKRRKSHPVLQLKMKKKVDK